MVMPPWLEDLLVVYKNPSIPRESLPGVDHVQESWEGYGSVTLYCGTTHRRQSWFEEKPLDDYGMQSRPDTEQIYPLDW